MKNIVNLAIVLLVLLKSIFLFITYNIIIQ